MATTIDIYNDDMLAAAAPLTDASDIEHVASEVEDVPSEDVPSEMEDVPSEMEDVPIEDVPLAAKLFAVGDEENVNNTTAETSFACASAPSDEDDEDIAVRSEGTLLISNTSSYTSFPSPSVKEAVSDFEKHRNAKDEAMAAWESRHQTRGVQLLSLAIGHMDVIDPKGTDETLDIEKGEEEKGNASKCCIAMSCWCCFVCAMLAVLLALIFTGTVELQSPSQLVAEEATPFEDNVTSLPDPVAVDSTFPSESPTTASPTFRATTAAPTTTTSPTTSFPTLRPTTTVPTTTWSPTTSAEGLINSLLAVTAADILADETSIQRRAWNWISEKGVLVPTNTTLTDKEVEEMVQQRYVMIMLDMAFHEEDSPFLARQESLSECEWLGVTCNDDSKVTGIAWPRQNLSTTLPTNIPEVSVLTELTRLDLAQNNLYGSLDALWQWELTSVKELFLHENQFTGSISLEMEDNIHALDNLESLYLGHNNLTGPFPSVFDGMPTLRYLILHYNQFSGSLPSGLRFKHLFYLDISHNLFSGQLPTDWGSPSFNAMRHIWLDHNDFEGEIPQNFEEIGNHRLWQFYINDNPRLTGSFPDNWNNKVWPNRFMTNVDISNTGLDQRLSGRFCMLSVFEEGEMVELRTNCDICSCDLCKHTCVE